jgi:hypothetical protein
MSNYGTRKLLGFLVGLYDPFNLKCNEGELIHGHDLMLLHLVRFNNVIS